MADNEEISNQIDRVRATLDRLENSPEVMKDYSNKLLRALKLVTAAAVFVYGNQVASQAFIEHYKIGEGDSPWTASMKSARLIMELEDSAYLIAQIVNAAEQHIKKEE